MGDSYYILLPMKLELESINDQAVFHEMCSCVFVAGLWYLIFLGCSFKAMFIGGGSAGRTSRYATCA